MGGVSQPLPARSPDDRFSSSLNPTLEAFGKGYAAFISVGSEVVDFCSIRAKGRSTLNVFPCILRQIGKVFLSSTSVI